MKNNQIYNMDCMEGLKSIQNEEIDLIITDPPYEVDYKNKSKHLGKLGKPREKQIERDSSFEDWGNLDYLEISKEWYRVLKEEAHIYIFCSDRQIPKWFDSLTKAGFKVPQVLIWKKQFPSFDMTFGHKFPENKEILLFAHKGWKKLNGYSIERHLFRSVIEVDTNHNNKFHPTEKPFNLLYYLITLSSKEGDLILDCFSGSGNHLIASKRKNRSFIGFEKSEKYYSIIQKRLKEEFEQKKLMEMVV